MGNLTPATFGLLLFSITLGSFGQICMKLGLRGDHAPASSPLQSITHILSSMLHPFVALGLALYVISTFTWLLLISRVRLSVAYPMISISYAMVMVLSVLILHETVHWPYAIIALACIGMGVSFIGLGLGRAQEK